MSQAPLQEPPAQPPPLPPEAYVGRAVRRKFATGWFTGTVSRARQTQGGGADGDTLWLVKYPGGNCEVMAWADLRNALVAAASDVGAGAPALGRADAPPEDDGSDGSPSCRTDTTGAAADGSDTARSGGGAPDAEQPGAERQTPPAAVPKKKQAASCKPVTYNGVHPSKQKAKKYPFTTWVKVPYEEDGRLKEAVVLRGQHRTAKSAARAADTLFRKYGMLHMLNFPRTPAEQSAAALESAAAGLGGGSGSFAERKQPCQEVPTARPPFVKRRAARLALQEAQEREKRAPLPPGLPPLPPGLMPTPVAPPPRLPAQMQLLPPPSPRPAASPPSSAPAAATAGLAEAADSSAAAAFLRGICPPLTCLDAALTALPYSGLTIELLRQVSRVDDNTPPAAHLSRIDIVCAGLGVEQPADKLRLAIALDELAHGS